MKILKLLNRKYLSIIIAILLIASSLNSEEQPVDIWNIDKEKIENSTSKEVPNLSRDNDNQLTESDIYNMQNDKEVNIVRVDEDLESKEIKIIIDKYILFNNFKIFIRDNFVYFFFWCREINFINKKNYSNNYKYN